MPDLSVSPFIVFGVGVLVGGVLMALVNGFTQSLWITIHDHMVGELWSAIDHVSELRNDLYHSCNRLNQTAAKIDEKIEDESLTSRDFVSGV